MKITAAIGAIVLMAGTVQAQTQAPAPQGLEPPEGWVSFIPQQAVSGNAIKGVARGVDASVFKIRGVRVQAAVNTPWYQQVNRGIAARNAVSGVLFSPITATCAVRIPTTPTLSPTGYLMVDMIVWTNEGWLDVASILRRRGLDELGRDHEAWRLPYSARSVVAKPSGGFGGLARRRSISLPPVRSVDSPRMMLAAF